MNKMKLLWTYASVHMSTWDLMWCDVRWCAGSSWKQIEIFNDDIRAALSHHFFASLSRIASIFFVWNETLCQKFVRTFETYSYCVKHFECHLHSNKREIRKHGVNWKARTKWGRINSGQNLRLRFFCAWGIRARESTNENACICECLDECACTFVGVLE